MGSLRHLALLLGVVACASPEPEPATPPGPAGAATCAAGQHACGATCVADAANTPELGCELGCGEACPAPANGVATCSAGGTCDVSCSPPYVAVDGFCVLAACEDRGYACGSLEASGAPDECGTCFAGTGCGADHQCAVAQDAREPNNAAAAAGDLGTFDDYDNAEQWIEELTIHAATDEDWFRFRVLDGFDGGNPDAFVQLADRATASGWLVSPHELTVWFQCDTADAGTIATCGSWLSAVDENSVLDAALGVGCQVDTAYVAWADIAASCTGTSDDGVVTVRVRKTDAPRGDPYDLYLRVD